MQTTGKTVRYYIDRDADTPIIRTVPVTRPVPTLANGNGTTPAAGAAPAETAAEHLAHQSSSGATRHRLASLVQASMRRKHRHGS